MDSFMFNVLAERAADGPDIEQLLDVSFGPGRFAKSAYRLRESVAPVSSLSFVAVADERLVGSIRFWPVLLGVTPGLLLGPLAVTPTLVGKGIGIALMRRGLECAKDEGHSLVVLVGDEPYYARVGFSKVPRGRLIMPGPVNPERLLVSQLEDDAFEGVSGLVSRAL